MLGEFSNGVRPGPGRGLQLDVGPKAGRILMSGSYDQIDPKPKGQRTVDLVWWSDEPGQAWHLSPSRLLDVDESSLVQLANGSLLLSMRNAVRPGCKCRAVPRSDDNGCARHCPFLLGASFKIERRGCMTSDMEPNFARLTSVHEQVKCLKRCVRAGRPGGL